MPTRSEILTALQFDYFQSFTMNGDAPGSARKQLSYSFHTDNSTFFGGAGYYGTHYHWLESERKAVREALSHVETFLNVDFVEITDNVTSDLDFGLVALSGNVVGEGGWQGWPANLQGFAAYDFRYDIVRDRGSIVLHEIGHALGLRHPFDTTILPAAFENKKYSLMSYTANPDTGGASKAMGLFDVLALQDIWGAARHNTGNTTYTGSRQPGEADTVWDSAGVDTFDASARAFGVVLDLGQGLFSRFGGFDDVVIAYGTVIENAVGSAYDDQVRGNGVDNRLEGRGGDDWIEGFKGDDVLAGGDGRDRLHGGGDHDRLGGGEGGDLMGGYFGADSLSGGAGNDRIFGGAGADRLSGGSGRDRMFGGRHDDRLSGGDDADKMWGGPGNDRLHGGAGDDTLHGDVDDGSTARSALFAGDDVLAGGRGDDRLFGGYGFDALIGGPGDDVLTGGAGADLFHFTSGRDRITDFTSGTDRVRITGHGDLADVLGQARDRDAGVRFVFSDDDVLTLEGVMLADLASGDILV